MDMLVGDGDQNSDPLIVASYDLIYFSILDKMFHENVPFAQTKYMPLMPKQAFIPSKCKKTLQALFKSLGEKHAEPFANANNVCLL